MTDNTKPATLAEIVAEVEQLEDTLSAALSTLHLVTVSAGTAPFCEAACQSLRDSQAAVVTILTALREQEAVQAELFEALLPTEYVDGRWVLATDDGEPTAVVSYSSEPNPETGHVGWCWWAMGRIGDARTQGEAKSAALAALARAGAR